MPMELERYNEIMNELNNPEITHERRSDLLRELQGDYSQVIQEHESLTKTKTELENENKDLLKTNSKLFREVNIQGDDDLEKEEEKKTFSETVTIADLEKTVNQKIN